MDFDSYIRCLKILRNFGVEILCPGHHAVFTDEDAVAQIEKSVQAAKEYLITAEKFLDQENGDIEKTVNLVKTVEWDPRPWPKQPESAYLLKHTIG